jgi:hypothetical protein
MASRRTGRRGARNQKRQCHDINGKEHQDGGLTSGPATQLTGNIDQRRGTGPRSAHHSCLCLARLPGHERALIGNPPSSRHSRLHSLALLFSPSH